MKTTHNSKETSHPPIQSFRIGSIESAIWERETENGVMFKVSFQKTYKSPEGNWATTTYFGVGDLLALSKVADQAHTWICGRDNVGGE